jgi:toxin ParE1/3/4
MRYKVTRHEQVRFDAAAILDFVGNFAGYKIGHQKVAEISRTISRLGEFPHIGSPREEVIPHLRIVPSAGNQATICFTVNDVTRTIKIICITYAGQDWQMIARERET